MHAVAKITLGVGAVILLAGILLTVLVGSRFETIATSSWDAEESTGATLYVLDEDRQGDIGFAFYVKGEYTDDDGDGVWDHCSGVEITVTQKPDVNTEWSEEDGDFFFQASEDKGKSCDVREGKDTGREGFVKLGMACVGCYEGDFEFESNQPVWVLYVDPALGRALASWGAGIGSGSCLCCGVVTLFLGGILALTLKEESVPTALQYDSEGRVVMQQPGEVSQGASGAVASDEVEGANAVDNWYEQTGDEEEEGLHSSFGGGFG